MRDGISALNSVRDPLCSLFRVLGDVGAAAPNRAICVSPRASISGLVSSVVICRDSAFWVRTLNMYRAVIMMRAGPAGGHGRWRSRGSAWPAG